MVDLFVSNLFMDTITSFCKHYDVVVLIFIIQLFYVKVNSFSFIVLFPKVISFLLPNRTHFLIQETKLLGLFAQDCGKISVTFIVRLEGQSMQEHIFPDLAVAIPNILFPREDVSLSTWAVIACDQFTSDPSYWSDVEQITRQAPSTAHMVLPELYLESLDSTQIDQKIQQINHTISTYQIDGIMRHLDPGFILIDRKTAFHPSRKGLLLAVDLEQYDFTPGNTMRIRATEGTVLSRIPPRVRIRKDALIELPHIMLLIDDPEKKVIDESLRMLQKDQQKPLYDFDLMKDGGHITGYFSPAHSPSADNIIASLSSLLAEKEDGFLFAVGDGNHSLATAKAHWKAISKSLPADKAETHPARFALVEVVNIHDDGLDFEPIHRVAFGLSRKSLFAYAGTFFADQGFHFYSSVDWSRKDTVQSGQVIPFLDEDDIYYLVLEHPKHSLAVGSLQNMLDHMIQENPSVRVDYIHGETAVRSLAKEGNIGFLLPCISKSSFFTTIETEGVFPRKTFSMGEAVEKRYYLEAKNII